MKHFEGHEEEVRERIHADKKKDKIEDEIRHEYKAAEDKAYHEMKSEKANWEEDMAAGERGERRQSHVDTHELTEEVDTELENGEPIE